MSKLLAVWKPIRLAIVCSLAFAAIAACRADVKVVESTTMDFSKMTMNGQPLTDQQLNMMKQSPMFSGGGMQITMYITADKSRIEEPSTVVIADRTAKTSTILNPTDKTYYVEQMPDPTKNPMISKAQVTVTDLGTTKALLGYSCHGYQVTMTMGMGEFDATLWSAQTIAGMPSGMSTGNTQLDAVYGKIHGFPLEMDGAMNSKMFGQVGFKYTVQSISTDPIPDSEFTVPSDYTKVDKPSFNPGILGQMGQPAPPQ